MPELSVVCWGFANRLDEVGGWGFSVHPSEGAADLWAQDLDIQRTIIGAGMNALNIPYLCGRGIIKNPSGTLLAQLGDKPGIFVRELGESELHLTSGNTPNEVTESFLDNMNSGPD